MVVLVYLFFGNAHVILHIGEDSRLDVVAFGERGFPSTLQFSSLTDAALNELQHTPLLLNTDLERNETRSRYTERYLSMQKQV